MSIYHFYLGGLAFVYIASAWLRYQAARVNPEIRHWYWLAIPLWLVFAGGYIWAIAYGISETRTVVLQMFALPFGIVVGIIPPLIKQKEGVEYRPTRLQLRWLRRHSAE